MKLFPIRPPNLKPEWKDLVLDTAEEASPEDPLLGGLGGGFVSVQSAADKESATPPLTRRRFDLRLPRGTN